MERIYQVVLIQKATGWYTCIICTNACIVIQSQLIILSIGFVSEYEFAKKTKKSSEEKKDLKV